MRPLILGAIAALIAVTAVLSAHIFAELQTGRVSYQEYAKVETADREARARSTAEKCRSFPALLSLSQCLLGEMQTHEQTLSTSRDLQAQQDMAFWGMWTTFVGFASLALSGIGLIVLLYTLRLNRAATTAAVNAAKAAISAVHSDRAWVCQADCNMQMQDDGSVTVKIVWANSGKTPAIRTRLEAGTVIVPVGEKPKPFTLPDLDDETHGTIGPGVTNAGPIVVLSAANVERLLDKEIEVYSYGRSRYFDVFHSDVQRMTECAFQIHARRTGQGSNWTATAFGPQNSAA